MFGTDSELTTEGLQALVTALSRLDETVDDAGRIEQLSALERVKSAVAAAQARVTVGFVTSQEQIAQGWREHAKACADDNDFDGWRQARDNANRASLEAPAPPDENSTGAKKSRQRPVVANGIASACAVSTPNNSPASPPAPSPPNLRQGPAPAPRRPGQTGPATPDGTLPASTSNTPSS